MPTLVQEEILKVAISFFLWSVSDANRKYLSVIQVQFKNSFKYFFKDLDSNSDTSATCVHETINSAIKTFIQIGELSQVHFH